MHYRISSIEWDLEDEDEDELALPDETVIEAETADDALDILSDREAVEVLGATVEVVEPIAA